jgi:hypothetical protein
MPSREPDVVALSDPPMFDALPRFAMRIMGDRVLVSLLTMPPIDTMRAESALAADDERCAIVAAGSANGGTRR